MIIYYVNNFNIIFIHCINIILLLFILRLRFGNDWIELPDESRNNENSYRRENNESYLCKQANSDRQNLVSL